MMGKVQIVVRPPKPCAHKFLRYGKGSVWRCEKCLTIRDIYNVPLRVLTEGQP